MQDAYGLDFIAAELRDERLFTAEIIEVLKHYFQLPHAVAQQLVVSYFRADMAEFLPDPDDEESVEMYWGTLMHFGGPYWYARHLLAGAPPDVQALSSGFGAVDTHDEPALPADYAAWAGPIRAQLRSLL
ncbi:hypothetical protein Deima_1622 [Deinococcus maricopensis DSM 21211]|uniref:Uncharacterized protein n=2 Tax=Deinococcus TaxID=1298 RepID=E8U882_DEIML|nr:hypothetical protein Deima_1622 [Deinococcus maricopensis DSM 21211]